MTAVLVFASILAPIVLALIQVVKKSTVLPKNTIPPIAILLGLAVGFVGYPFTELAFDLRLWAGGLAGLASVGLFELGTSRPGDTKSDTK